jgi:hypothetical protein
LYHFNKHYTCDSMSINGKQLEQIMLGELLLLSNCEIVKISTKFHRGIAFKLRSGDVENEALKYTLNLGFAATHLCRLPRALCSLDGPPALKSAHYEPIESTCFTVILQSNILSGGCGGLNEILKC